MRLLIIGAFIFFANPSYAWKIEGVFKGMSTNVTKPGSYRDQAAGYYSGGGLSMRMRSHHIQPFTVTPPHLKMGCGGIDMYLGSLSMVSGPELVKLAKSLGSQASSYAFQLGLKTFAPQIENLLKDLRNLAMQLNEFSAEECQLVQSAFAGMLPKDSAMREAACKDIQNGGAKDYFKAREKCNDDAAQKTAVQKAQSEDKELLIDNYNLFMKAAEKAGIPSDLREDMMSMVGTIVKKDKELKIYEALAKDEKTWSTYLKGGNGASKYSCSDKECLDINVLKDQTIAYNNSYQGKAEIKLNSLKQSFQANTAFTQENINFLTSIGDSFPIYDYICLEVMSGVTILEKASELVATHMLIHYLGEVISEVRRAIAIMQSKQMDDQHLKDYLASLDRVQAYAITKWQTLLDIADRIDKKARTIEQQVIARER